jgi:hypothetical protein
MGSGWNTTATRGEVAQMLWNLTYLVSTGSKPPVAGDAWVYADGSGDFPTHEEAVAGLGDGSTIHLSSATST